MNGIECVEQTISVIIPVLDEGPEINEVLDDLASIGEDLEIIAVDSSENCDTLSLITHPSVIKERSGMGRGVQMNAGAARANGSLLVFLHADTKLPPDGLKKIRNALDKFVAGAFSVEFTGSSNPFFRLLGLGHTIRSRITRIPYGDQAIFFRAQYFRDIGGYSEEPLMEDAEIMKRIKNAGDDIIILDSKVSTSSRRFVEEGIIRSLFRYARLRTLDALGCHTERW